MEEVIGEVEVIVRREGDRDVDGRLGVGVGEDLEDDELSVIEEWFRFEGDMDVLGNRMRCEDRGRFDGLVMEFYKDSVGGNDV